MRFSILGLAFASVLSGCVSTTPTTSALSSTDVTTFYDYQLHSPSGNALALQNLPDELKKRRRDLGWRVAHSCWYSSLPNRSTEAAFFWRTPYCPIYGASHA